MKREEATAYHEAGHAVMSALTGRRFIEVTIRPDEDAGNLGSVSHVEFPAWFNPEINQLDCRHRNWIEREVMVNFAGQIAQRKAAGHRAGSWKDNENAIDIASYFVSGPRELGGYLSWLYIRAENFMELGWSLVELIAKALLEHKTLSGRKIRSIVREATTVPGRTVTVKRI